MATKKKHKKKSTKAKKNVGAKVKPAKKPTQKKKSPTKSAKRAAGNKTISRKTARGGSNQPRKKRPGRARSAYPDQLPGPDSAGQSGDLQGLSDVERADSESVDELIEEGNAFEAGIIEGVEEADDGGVREVHTREVPEDDVPGEYLDEE